jgi:methyl-accepting chemotaxis protein
MSGFLDGILSRDGAHGAGVARVHAKVFATVLLAVLSVPVIASMRFPGSVSIGSLTVLSLAVSVVAVVASYFLISREVGALAGADAAATRVVSEELPKLTSAINEVAAGNLTARIGFDESMLVDGFSSGATGGRTAPNGLGTVLSNLDSAFDEMTAGLRSLIGLAADISRRVQEGSDTLAEASDESTRAADEVASAISSVADGAVSQAAVTDRVAQHVVEIEGAVAAAVEAVDHVSTVSQRAENTASSGKTRLDEAIAAMGRITSSFGDVAETVQQLGARSEKVDEIVDLIRSIADQTNLLALNAAIEAARAGDAGRGFAVVAAEVKSLAEESARSTEQIADLVGSIRESAADARSATNAGKSEVDRGAEIIDDAGSAFRDIVDAVNLMEEKARDLTTATTSISGATEAIGHGVKDLVVVTESNSAASEEVAASSEEMAATAAEIGSTAQDLAASSRDLAAALRGFTFGDGSLDFAAAISAHRAWKARIRNYLKGVEELHAEDVASHTECELGTWLYSFGAATYGHRPEMASLEADHQALHREIHSVISANTSGDSAGADQAYARVTSLSEHVVADLTALQSGS